MKMSVPRAGRTRSGGKVPRAGTARALARAGGGEERPPCVAITMGDPGGIGPEVVVKALGDPEVRRLARFRVLGIASVLTRTADELNIEIPWGVVRSGGEVPDGDVVVLDYEHTVRERERAYPARANALSGKLTLAFVRDAVGMACARAGDSRRVDAIVTGPIAKESWALAGEERFAGHTELIAHQLGAERFAMMFVSPKLRVILATIHIPLAEVPTRLTRASVLETIELGHEACVRLGVEKPRIAVCGLNPHAGEHGLLGKEEETTIGPAIATAKKRGVDARGPFPGDTIFNAAVAGAYDLVVAMYHDQGLIPLKLLARDEAVNVTVGLPIVRTSPDHGTAFDIAGKGVAEAGSMIAAVRLAVSMRK